jgi:hypothetical protein
MKTILINAMGCDRVGCFEANKGPHFRVALTHPLQTKTCPMSSASLAEGPKGVVAAWETNGQVFTVDGQPIDEPGRLEGGVPVWGLPTVVARPDGGFTIVR